MPHGTSAPDSHGHQHARDERGYEAAAEIRKFAAEIPIVAVTAYAYASDEQKIMQNGFTGYMPKPINAPQLKKQILDILRERITLI